MSPSGDTIYPGGFANLMKFLDRRQAPFVGVSTFLPPKSVDLKTLWKLRVSAPTADRESFSRLDVRRKSLELQDEFIGQPRLLHLHALLVAILRRDNPPDAAMRLFLRIWREEGQQLAEALPVRWLISATTTFADCGETGDQRALGMGLSLLFDMIKLHDTERRSTGISGDTPSTFVGRKERPPLAFGMAPYSLRKGDLDKILVARLWKLAEREPTMRHLAMCMLRMVISDRRSVFARLQVYKDTQ